MSCCDYIVYDHHTGNEICSGCGKLPNLSPYKIDYTSLHKEDKRVRPKRKIIERLEETCAKNNIPSAIVDQALYYFNGKRAGLESAAFCLYKACNDFCASRSLKEIACMFDLPVDSIKMKEEQTEIVATKPSELAYRICVKLGVTKFAEIQLIGNRADMCYSDIMMSCPPQSALAVNLYMHLESSAQYENTTKLIRNISTACDISVSCTRRLIRVYKKQIQFLCQLSID